MVISFSRLEIQVLAEHNALLPKHHVNFVLFVDKCLHLLKVIVDDHLLSQEDEALDFNLLLNLLEEVVNSLVVRYASLNVFNPV